MAMGDEGEKMTSCSLTFAPRSKRHITYVCSYTVEWGISWAIKIKSWY